jgi:hypothetical protein
MIRVRGLVIFLLLNSTLLGQNLFLKSIGGEGDDVGYSIYPTNDGGFVLAGYTKSYGAGNSDIIFTKLDWWGNLLWVKTIGGSYPDRGHSILELNDGGYLLLGYTISFGAGYLDIFLARIDPVGNVKWMRTLGGVMADVGNSSVESSEGNYVIVGGTESFGAGESDVLIAKFDPWGNLVWAKTIGGEFSDWGYSLIEDSEERYVIVGYTESFGDMSRDLLLMKMDRDGDLMWARAVGGTNMDAGHYVIEVSDGGYVSVGYTYSFGSGDADILIVKFDEYGYPIWAKVAGGEGEDVAYSVIEDLDGGYLVAGYTGDFNRDVVLLKLDTEGELIWSRRVDGDGVDEGYSILRLFDSFVISGLTQSLNSDDWDILLVRLDDSGFSCVGDSLEFNLQDISPNFVTVFPLEYTPPFEVHSPNLEVSTPQFNITTYCEITLDHPPSGFSLLYPGDGDTVTILENIRWEEAVDPDTGDTVYYDLYISMDSTFTTGTIVIESLRVEEFQLQGIAPNNLYFWKVKAYDRFGLSIWSNELWSFYLVSFIPGDANGDGVVNPADITYLANYLFGSGPPPQPLLSGDTNGDCEVNQVDLSYLANYLFFAGPAPQTCSSK